ncbi:Multicopper oxidase with three cupredoxin domains (includes cell division protein FtsP and spore coat protein CotA) [Micromonospora nigra]|uniref:Multicopper oxidase with three cupredoxin domains (Includes cell division protein FtsP and spore coat protein CotA) n=2 Tax=Micromonospora nigra TaxID=145857 RepID=A0A1C6RCK0_9ACTN|nr:multicopper oxidase domain-containing protein [Micromonospora nigra]SCL14792.1 Multicopper oxidase with three cupredoxin domains (includes cell division protein FtsP and spore coat protein CotA) [Micromonospora nigra]
MDNFVDRRTVLTSAVLGSVGVVAGVSLQSQNASGSVTVGGRGTQSTAPTFGLTKFLDPLRIPPTIRAYSRRHRDELTITMTNARTRLHSQLPQTRLWTYEGQFPGPTIEVRSGRRLRVAWTNELRGTVPLVAVRAPYAQPTPANTPGYRDPDGSLPALVELIDGVADLPPWNVVHLHGAVTNGGNDGWAHNGISPGEAQLTEYPNRQPAAALWYHDHAMAVTRFNVHAGLAGLYLIRDEEEDGLGLPGGDREIPLVITDRNLDTDPATGALTGQLLFKFQYLPATGTTAPVTGPFTLVNGVIWPHLDVDARWYRFRVLNAANGRFFRLDLVDEAGTVHNDAVRIIGTDVGLLPAPAAVPAGGLTITPAERVDLLVDFSRFRGQRLRLVNTGASIEPDIMEFRVESRGRNDPFTPPARLSSSYARLDDGVTVPADHDEVFVATTPPGVAGRPHPEMWELKEITRPAEVPTRFPQEGVIQLTDPATGKVRTFRTVARLFDDTRTIFINRGRWVVWNLIQLGGAPHPMHIHMARFQLLSRRKISDLTAFDVAVGGTSAPLLASTDGPPIERHEEGWKDTFSLWTGEWIRVAGQFEGATGEFMYHCHILDHEDEGMMRPFVVHPPEVARFHLHPGGSGHGGHS